MTLLPQQKTIKWITSELLKGDAYFDYDIEVTKEGEAINEYLSLVTTKR